MFVFQEHWYMSYIDLLQRFELWNVSNEVIKLSTCGAIMCLNQASTTLHINCSNCKRPMSNKGWICDRYDLQALTFILSFKIIQFKFSFLSSVPFNIRAPMSIMVFKGHLKVHLFSLLYCVMYILFLYSCTVYIVFLYC